MITLSANKQKMRYSLQTEKIPIYETDDDGNIKYITVDGVKIPVETGEYEPGYAPTVEFRANINSTLTEAFIKAFGVDDSSDKATIVCSKGFLPFDVGTRIWRKTPVRYKDAEQKIIDGDSADYVVIGVNDESLNEDSFLLKRVNK